ncbi:ecotin [Strigomonas culicis]|uniref:Ecotin n=1 Tax=Strigomonas culicis TaxID=28005 RepID=S9VYU3_9TRYP|nr:ecotin [Strigomonas culicis]|eukprot:EPY32286.1 ecotin [Strigomonas culicis]
MHVPLTSLFLLFFISVPLQFIIATSSFLLLLLLLVFIDTSQAFASTMPKLADYKAPYPAPTAGQKRCVIYLEPKGDDVELNDYKVELIPGRVEMVDGANRHMMGGSVEDKVLEGWGYSFYVVQLGMAASTRMMPLGPAAEKRPVFVSIPETPLVRYNSKLPIVVYLPKDGELRYRIWSAVGAGGSAEALVAKEE